MLVLRPGPHLGLEDRNNVLRFWLELSPRFFSGTHLPCWRKSYAEKNPIWDLLPTSAGRRSVKEWSLSSLPLREFEKSAVWNGWAAYIFWSVSNRKPFKDMPQNWSKTLQISLWRCLSWKETPNIVVDLQILRLGCVREAAKPIMKNHVYCVQPSSSHHSSNQFPICWGLLFPGTSGISGKFAGHNQIPILSKCYVLMH